MISVSRRGISSGEASDARPFGVRRMTRSWVNATADAPAESPGIRRDNKPAKLPARRHVENTPVECKARSLRAEGEQRERGERKD